MALTARDLHLMVRVQTQGTNNLRRLARDVGGLRNLRSVSSVQTQAANAAAAAEKKRIDLVQKARLNYEQLNRAMAQSSRLSRLVAAGRPLRGFNMAETKMQADAAASAVERLTVQQGRLADATEEARLAAEQEAAAYARLARIVPLERFQAFAQTLGRISRTARIGGAIGLVATGMMAVSAAKLSSGAMLAATQMRQPGQSLASVRGSAENITQSTINLMKQFPASAQDMQDSFYQIFSGTNIQKIPQATQMLKTFNEMAVAGGSDLKTMTDAGISLYNNFPKGFKNMTDAANQFFAIVRYGRMNATQFATSLTRVLPVAKAAGLSFRDVGDAMAFITRQTGGARTGLDATGLARLIEMLGNDKVIAGLKKYGINVKDASGKMRPFADLIKEIHDKLVATGKFKPGPQLLNFIKEITSNVKQGKATGGMAGTIQGRRILDYLLTDTSAYLQVAGQVNLDTKEMQKSFEAMNKSPGVQWARFVNQMKVLAYTIGVKMIPAFIQLGKPVAAIVKWFEKLSPHTQKLIAQFAVFGSAGLLVAGMLGGIISAVGRLVLAFMLMNRRGGIMAALLGGEAGAASPQVAIIITAIGALILLFTQFPGVLKAATNALGGFKGVLEAITILIAGFTVVKVLSGLALIGGEASIAAGLVAKLRLALLGLTFLGAIAIPIILKVTSSAGKPHGHDQFTTKFSSGLGGFFQKSLYAAEYGVSLATGSSKSDARRIAGSLAGAAGARNQLQGKNIPLYYQRLLGRLTANGQVTNYALEAAQRFVWNGDYAQFMKVYRYYFPLAAKVRIGGNDIDPRQTSRAAIASSAIAAQHHTVLSQSFMQRLAAVGRLDLAYGKNPTLANFKKYQDALAALNKDYNSKLYQSYISDYLSRVESADRSHLSKTKKDNSAYLSQLQSMYSNINTMYQNFLQQQQSIYGSLFQGPYMQSAAVQSFLSFNNNKPTPGMVLKDLHSQLFQGNRFNSIVNQLKKKGTSQGIIDQIMAQGPSAMPFIQAMNHLSPKQLAEYNATWNRMQKAIKTNTMKQLNSQLTIYEHFGKKVAQAIIAGISSEDPKLQNKLENIINSMFPDLAKKAGKAPKTVPRGNKTTVHPTTHVTHLHYSPTINNPRTENTSTALKKSFFHMKQHQWF